VDQKTSGIIFGILPGIYLFLAFVYLITVVRPDFYFHHVQPPFLLSTDYLGHYFTYPGGFSRLIANLLMQSFYSRFLGPVVLFAIALATMWLSYNLMNTMYQSRLNLIWSLAPLTLTIVLANNYNLPFSVIVSLLLVLLLLLLPAKKGKSPAGMLALYTAGAIMVYYFCGSGYMLLFSFSALFLAMKFKPWKSLLVVAFIAGFSLLLPLVASVYVFPVPPDQRYFYFFPPTLYFMAYEPSWIFYFCLLSVPALLVIARMMAWIDARRDNIPFAAVAGSLIMALALSGHFATYRGDARKIVASDYYCYHNDPRRTARAAMGLEEYSFAANLNYNLAISKAGTLTEDFFDFFQISGTDALYPDVEFALEMSFIAADFYYDLGYISEARHWAYASLVYYPNSPRALRLLVKIHLVTGEYRAAERCLHILSKGLINRKFVKDYSSCLQDTSLISNRSEITEKRSFIPPGKELSPFIDERFRELLEANDGNKRAYEDLMLYYLMDAQLERFVELYEKAGKYFRKPVDVYEEAILIYGKMKHIPVEEKFHISPATMDRYNKFNRILDQYGEDEKLARNVLYWEMGKTYMYYLRFLYPRIIKPEIIQPGNEGPPI
jgi:tetratricopeptide (TPR) repeat protein